MDTRENSLMRNKHAPGNRTGEGGNPVRRGDHLGGIPNEVSMKSLDVGIARVFHAALHEVLNRLVRDAAFRGNALPLAAQSFQSAPDFFHP